MGPPQSQQTRRTRGRTRTLAHLPPASTGRLRLVHSPPRAPRLPRAPRRRRAPRARSPPQAMTARAPAPAARAAAGFDEAESSGADDSVLTRPTAARAAGSGAQQRGGHGSTCHQCGQRGTPERPLVRCERCGAARHEYDCGRRCVLAAQTGGHAGQAVAAELARAGAAAAERNWSPVRLRRCKGGGTASFCTVCAQLCDCFDGPVQCHVSKMRRRRRALRKLRESAGRPDRHVSASQSATLVPSAATSNSTACDTTHPLPGVLQANAGSAHSEEVPFCAGTPPRLGATPLSFVEPPPCAAPLSSDGPGNGSENGATQVSAAASVALPTMGASFMGPRRDASFTGGAPRNVGPVQDPTPLPTVSHLSTSSIAGPDERPSALAGVAASAAATYCGAALVGTMYDAFFVTNEDAPHYADDGCMIDDLMAWNPVLDGRELLSRVGG